MSGPATTAPEVSVVVVTHDSEAHIGACLEALRAESRRVPLEVIVVDNASADGTRARVAAEHPEATLLAQAENRGFAAGCNAGARATRGRFLLLLNPDAVIRPRAVAELVEATRIDPRPAVVGPRIMRPDGRVERSYGPMVGFFGEAWQKVVGSLYEADPPGIGAVIRWLSLRERWPAWVSGACLLVERSLWDELGGMDEGFFLYFEDVDFCARVRAAGGRVLYWPRAEVVHVRGASVAAARLRERVRVEYRRSQERFYRQHHGEAAARLVRLLAILHRAR